MIRHRLDNWRLSSDTGKGTLGELQFDGLDFCFIVEPAWRNNRPDDKKTAERDASCIPSGHYEIEVRKDDHWPLVVELFNVPKRSGVLMHSGDDKDDSIGCLVVGQNDGGEHSFLKFGKVRRSKVTLAKLCKMLGPGRHDLYVHSVAETITSRRKDPK